MPVYSFSGGNESAGGWGTGIWSVGFILSLLGADDTTVVGNASEVTFSNPFFFGGTNVLVAQGTFGNYNANGPQTGTVTSFQYTTYFTNGVPVTMSVTGLSISVASLNTWVVTDNEAALAAALFGGHDTFTGTEFADGIGGFTGNDAINGAGGDDELSGRDGNDTINGGAGNDTMDGGAGNDTLNGEDGDDQFVNFGGVPDPGIDIIDGGSGNDFIELFLNSGAPISFSTALMASAEGITLPDGTLIRNVEALQLWTGEGNDTLTIHAPGGIGSGFRAWEGEDTLIADFSLLNFDFTLTPGSPSLIGGFAGYALESVERFLVSTGSGRDLLRGGTGDDILSAGGGNDELNGGFGDDTLMGGAGDDLINGSNPFTGGDGVDTASYADATAGVTVSLLLQGQQNTSGAGLDTLFDIENLTGSAFDDTLGGDANANTLFGGDGNDTLAGDAGADIIDGGEGRDTASFGVVSDGATWSRNASGVITVTSVNDVDTVTNTEVLRFTDRDVLIDRPARSFSGNGTSDVLFRRSDGIMATWEVTGTTINAASFLPTAGAEWTPRGTGDFNGDGRDDVLWQRSDGLVYTWHMNGGSVASANAITGIGAEWNFLGVGDFNGDLKDDIAWRRDDGIVFIWQMDGVAIASANSVTGLGSDWQIAGLGDFNSDGRDDFLWRNESTSQSVIWHMNGSAIQSFGATSQQATLDWSIVGVGDTNGDGRDDIILRRASDGMVSVWAMDGTTVSSASDVGAADPSVWNIRSIGDYNGDGRDDILWQHDNGLVFVWLLNGAAIVGSGGLSGVGADWSLLS